MEAIAQFFEVHRLELLVEHHEIALLAALRGAFGATDTEVGDDFNYSHFSDARNRIQRELKGAIICRIERW